MVAALLWFGKAGLCVEREEEEEVVELEVGVTARGDRWRVQCWCLSLDRSPACGQSKSGGQVTSPPDLACVCMCAPRSSVGGAISSVELFS